MTSARSILHMSRTPLVGAPGKIAAALNAHTDFRAAAIVAEDYPRELAGLFLGESIVYEEKSPIRDVCKQLVRSADVIHVHNDLTIPLRQLVHGAASNKAKFVYHVHSPLREGPLFFDRADILGFDWSARLSIPHYPQRFFQDYRLVPNIVLFPHGHRPLGDRDPARVLFSPAHRRRGLRWGDKVSTALETSLSSLRSAGEADVIDVKGIRPSALFELRLTTHVSIDEIVTGAFHQVSLEGLCAGNVVVNGADWFAVKSFQMATGASDGPPFVRMDEDDVAIELPELVRDRERIRRFQRASWEYYQAHLLPAKLVGRFVDVYEEVLDAG